MNRRMPVIDAALRACALVLTMLALAGCGGARLTGTGPEPSALAASPAQPGAPPVAMAGRWLLSSPGQGQCNMNFGAPSGSAGQGTIAPEGGCPGKFFTSRKWTYEQSGLVIRDHNGQPLAYLSGGAAQFTGKATSGEAVTLIR
jgi:hypothetical protein